MAFRIILINHNNNYKLYIYGLVKVTPNVTLSNVTPPNNLLLN